MFWNLFFDSHLKQANWSVFLGGSAGVCVSSILKMSIIWGMLHRDHLNGDLFGWKSKECEMYIRQLWRISPLKIVHEVLGVGVPSKNHQRTTNRSLVVWAARHVLQKEAQCKVCLEAQRGSFFFPEDGRWMTLGFCPEPGHLTLMAVFHVVFMSYLVRI